MKRKYMLLGLAFLFLIQSGLYMNSMDSKRELEESQKAYEALADKRMENSEDMLTASPGSEGPGTLPSDVQDNAIVFSSNPFAEYYSVNPEFSGWLTIEGTKVDYPVARANDNTYYLTHSFKRKSSELGAIFMDYRNVGMGLDAHTVLYGHYTESGYMFGGLDRYLSRSYLESHQEIIFMDPYTERRYKVFSVHVSSAEGALIQVDLTGEEQAGYLTMLKEKSIHTLDIPVSDADKILTLVTCNYGIRDGRLFVHAVQIKEDEAKE